MKRSVALFPIVLALGAILVAPPALTQTKFTPVPVAPTPKGLRIARSPALSPFTLESTPERIETGCPD